MKQPTGDHLTWAILLAYLAIAFVLILFLASCAGGQTGPSTPEPTAVRDSILITVESAP